MSKIIIVNNGQFSKVLNYVKTAQTDEKLHALAMFALKQCNIHGQTGPLNDLFTIKVKSLRLESLRAWVHDYFFIVRKEDKTYKFSNEKRRNYIKELDVEVNFTKPDEMAGALMALHLDADLHPFFEKYEETKPIHAFDVLQGIEHWVKSKEKAIAENKFSEVTHVELLAKIKALLEE